MSAAGFKSMVGSRHECPPLISALRIQRTEGQPGRHREILSQKELGGLWWKGVIIAWLNAGSHGLIPKIHVRERERIPESYPLTSAHQQATHRPYTNKQANALRV